MGLKQEDLFKTDRDKFRVHLKTKPRSNVNVNWLANLCFMFGLFKGIFYFYFGEIALFLLS